MALYPVLKTEGIVQVDDRTRLSALSSYSNGGDSITQVEIDAGDGNGFLDVTSDRYLDVQYDTDGDKTVQVRLNASSTESQTLSVLTVAADLLFSTDRDLEVHEPEILKYVREGRNSYLDVHRRVQALILDWLDYNRYWKRDNMRFEKADLIDIQDFKQWSTYYVLQIIFKGLSNKNDDKWMEKSAVYKQLAESARGRGTYRLDKDGSGEIDPDELKDNWSKPLIRR